MRSLSGLLQTEMIVKAESFTVISHNKRLICHSTFRNKKYFTMYTHLAWSYRHTILFDT